MNGVFQRFMISAIFFFLLSVAERTFKQVSVNLSVVERTFKQVNVDTGYL